MVFSIKNEGDQRDSIGGKALVFAAVAVTLIQIPDTIFGSLSTSRSYSEVQNQEYP